MTFAPVLYFVSCFKKKDILFNGMLARAKSPAGFILVATKHRKQKTSAMKLASKMTKLLSMITFTNVIDICRMR